MDSDPRRAYLAKHGVEAAVTAAITKALEKQPTDPVAEIGRCLMDANYVVPAGKVMLPVLQYVSTYGVKSAVSEAIKGIASAMPADPIAALGKKLALGDDDAPTSEFMAYWCPKKFTASALTEKDYEASLKMPYGKRMMLEREARGMLDADVPASEFMDYWAPRVASGSALGPMKFKESLALPYGKRMMLEREARGVEMADVVQSEFMMYWSPRLASGSALPKEEFVKSLALPAGKRMMLERAARGFLEMDNIVAPPARTEFEQYWAPSEFKDSALPTEKIFMLSLQLPMGKRMMMEREARGIADPSEFKMSEYEKYWAPSTFKKSALTTMSAYEASLKMPFGKRCMIEREARGFVDADVARSEFMEFWTPRQYEASAITKKSTFEASLKMPFGKRMVLEREARGYCEVDMSPETKVTSEYLAYWAPVTAAKSALKPDKFAASLSMPDGARTMLEREARGVKMIA